MASIVQSPAPLDLQGVAGSPYVLTLNITLKNAAGDTISWSDADEFIPFVQGLPSWSPNQLVEIASLEPTMVSPENNVVTLSWSTAQTQALGLMSFGRWAFLMLFEAEGGPYSLVAGSISMTSPTSPGSSATTTADLAVTIGASAVSLTVVLA